MSQRCTATTKAGLPCRAWAVEGADLCAAHLGRTGAPPGNRNAETHGAYSRPNQPLETLADVAEGLRRNARRIQQYIDANITSLDIDDLARLAALEAQTLSRLARVLKQEADSNDHDLSALSADIDKALNMAADLLGVDL